MTEPISPVTLTSAPEGAVYARRVVADYLREYLPQYLAVLREQWGVRERDLPDPREIQPHPAVAVDRWPLIAVSNAEDSPSTRIEQGGGSIEYDTTYRLRVFSWVNTEHEAPIYDMRDRYAAAIKTALIDSPDLRGLPVVVEENAVSISYGGIQKVNGDRFVAGSFVALGLRVREELVRRPSATVASVKVDYHLLPPLPLSAPISVHPALG